MPQQATYYAELAKAVRADLVQTSSEYGYEVVDVDYLVDTLMLAFRWHETGDTVFVYASDLQIHVDGHHPVAMAETIISTNFLENIGAGWFKDIDSFSVGGLTFFAHQRRG